MTQRTTGPTSVELDLNCRKGTVSYTRNAQRGYVDREAELAQINRRQILVHTIRTESETDLSLASDTAKVHQHGVARPVTGLIELVKGRRVGIKRDQDPDLSRGVVRVDLNGGIAERERLAGPDLVEAAAEVCPGPNAGASDVWKAQRQERHSRGSRSSSNPRVAG